MSTCRSNGSLLLSLACDKPLSFQWICCCTSIYISFICTAKIDMSTCRPVDLSTCRLVDLSTCRASAIVYNKDPDRVRVSVWLGLGLG